jgi:tryptophanyl-tRNA synthetase
MSKSYNNAVYLTEPAEDVDRKLSRMVTDPRRARRTDPGDPADCPAYESFHKTYCTPEELAQQAEGCRSASIGCLECKQIMIRHVQAELEPIRTRRAALTSDDARRALAAGNATARAVAEATMADVRAAMGIG